VFLTITLLHVSKLFCVRIPPVPGVVNSQFTADEGTRTFVGPMGRQECEMHQKDAVKKASAPPQSRRDKHLRNNVARDTEITGRDDVAVGEAAGRPHSNSG
jgi:hypothetical protein